jgi:hypothetical protein
MWHALTQTQSVGDALERLATEYDVDHAVLERDLLALTEDLLVCGLLELN